MTTHQFISIENLTKPKPADQKSIGLRFEQIMGTRVVCAFCGQVRSVWADGKIDVEVELGEIANLAETSNECQRQ